MKQQNAKFEGIIEYSDDFEPAVRRLRATIPGNGSQGSAG